MPTKSPAASPSADPTPGEWETKRRIESSRETQVPMRPRPSPLPERITSGTRSNDVAVPVTW